MQATRSAFTLHQLPSGISELWSLSRYTMRSLRRLKGAPSTTQLSRAGPWALQHRNLTIKQLSAEQENRERVVILGSGWAGYNIARLLNPKKFQAVVVSPRSHFAFTPLLASTAVGTLEFRTALEPVRTRRSNIHNFFQGWADDVDFKNKTITIEESVTDPTVALAPTGDRHARQTSEERRGEKIKQANRGKLFELSYDKLIISVGCYSQTFGTSGVKEYALFLKDVGDARKIRNRLLACFESAALPTTTDDMRRMMLNFAVVGGGPTGIEFSAELHDIIHEDLARIYPELIQFHKITVYDVAPKVLPMFDQKLADYAMASFRREGIDIKTSHHVQELRKGAPGESAHHDVEHNEHSCYTLKLKEEGEIGVGMVVWSTGLMQNPFVAHALGHVQELPETGVQFLTPGTERADPHSWYVRKDGKTGSVITDEHLRVTLEAKGEDSSRAVLKDVYAIGDCAIMEGTTYPATAQVASQKASWLAKRLNKGDLDTSKFTWKNLGVMAYIGNWNAVFQSGSGGNVSGRAAWLLWRTAYLTKSVSLRNKILIPVYWFVNWLFGRDISRF